MDTSTPTTRWLLGMESDTLSCLPILPEELSSTRIPGDTHICINLCTKTGHSLLVWDPNLAPMNSGETLPKPFRLHTHLPHTNTH